MCYYLLYKFSEYLRRKRHFLYKPSLFFLNCFWDLLSIKLAGLYLCHLGPVQDKHKDICVLIHLCIKKSIWCPLKERTLCWRYGGKEIRDSPYPKRVYHLMRKIDIKYWEIMNEINSTKEKWQVWTGRVSLHNWCQSRIPKDDYELSSHLDKLKESSRQKNPRWSEKGPSLLLRWIDLK